MKVHVWGNRWGQVLDQIEGKGSYFHLGMCTGAWGMYATRFLTWGEYTVGLGWQHTHNINKKQGCRRQVLSQSRKGQHWSSQHKWALNWGGSLREAYPDGEEKKGHFRWETREPVSEMGILKAAAEGMGSADWLAGNAYWKRKLEK